MTDHAISQYSRLKKHLSMVSEDEYVSLLLQIDENGKTNKRELYKEIIKALSISGISDKDMYLDFRAHYPTFIQSMPDMNDTLSWLMQNSYKICIVSNGNKFRQKQKVKILGIDNYVEDDCILVSGELGISKPDPRIYALALEGMGIQKPEEAVFVGNDPVEDIRGAHRVGLKTIWMNDGYWDPPIEADATIESLDQLPQVLSSLA